MPSFQATLPGKPDQMSPIRAAVPSEREPVRLYESYLTNFTINVGGESR